MSWSPTTEAWIAGSAIGSIGMLLLTRTTRAGCPACPGATQGYGYALGQASGPAQDPNAPTPADLQVIAAGLVAYQARATDQDVANGLAKFTYEERHQIAQSMRQQGGDPARTTTEVEMADRQVGDAPAPVAAWEWTKAGGWKWILGGAAALYVASRVL